MSYLVDLLNFNPFLAQFSPKSFKRMFNLINHFLKHFVLTIPPEP